MARLRHLGQVISGRYIVKLLPASDYTIRVVVPSTLDAAPTSEIIIAGVPTGRTIGGAVLKASLRWNEYVLLFLTDDVPFEETLSIYLLDADLMVVDSARMYFIYSTGIFSYLDVTQPDTVRFRFFEGIVWILKLFPKRPLYFPSFQIPGA